MTQRPGFNEGKACPAVGDSGHLRLPYLSPLVAGMGLMTMEPLKITRKCLII